MPVETPSSSTVIWPRAAAPGAGVWPSGDWAGEYVCTNKNTNKKMIRCLVSTFAPQYSAVP